MSFPAVTDTGQGKSGKTFFFNLYTGLYFNNLYVICLQECLLVSSEIAIAVKSANILWRRPSPSLYICFPNSSLLTTFFRQYRPKEIRDKYKNEPMRESCFFIYRRLQNNKVCFLNTFLNINRLHNNLMYQKELKEKNKL